MATIYKGNAQTAKTLAMNVTAKVIYVVKKGEEVKGFNCLAMVDGKEIKTYSTISMLKKEGENLLNEKDIAVDKTVIISQLVENLIPGKDPMGYRVFGTQEYKPESLTSFYEDTEEEVDENFSWGGSYSKNHKKIKVKFSKEKYRDGNRDRQEKKQKGGANTRQFDLLY